jgi:hypothetical protein
VFVTLRWGVDRVKTADRSTCHQLSFSETVKTKLEPSLAINFLPLNMVDAPG